MARIEFDGKGEPIPALALPPVGSGDIIATTVLTFNESTEFSVSDYMTLGFTHYEVWCVGGAGGRGGDGSDSMTLLEERSNRSVPQDVWNLHLEANSYDDWAYQRLMYEYYRFFYFHPTIPEPDFWWAADATPAVLNKVYNSNLDQDSEIMLWILICPLVSLEQNVKW